MPRPGHSSLVHAITFPSSLVHETPGGGSLAGFKGFGISGLGGFGHSLRLDTRSRSQGTPHLRMPSSHCSCNHFSSETVVRTFLEFMLTCKFTYSTEHLMVPLRPGQEVTAWVAAPFITGFLLSTRTPQEQLAMVWAVGGTHQNGLAD